MFLRHEAEGARAAMLAGVSGWPSSVIAGIGRAQAGDERHRGGLAGAVRPEQAEELAAREVERDAVEGGERAVALW